MATDPIALSQCGSENKKNRAKIVWAVLPVAVLYFVVWMILAYPYRVIPTDDTAFLFFLHANLPYSHALESPYPVFLLILRSFYSIWKTLPLHDDSVLLLVGAFSNSVIIVFIGLITAKISKSFSATLGAVFLYAVNAWPSNYHFFFSYTLPATMLYTISLYFLILAYHCYEDLNLRRGAIYLGISGFLSGLFFWTSSSAPVQIMIQGLMYLAMFKNILLKNKRIEVFIFAGALLCAIVAVPIFPAQPMFSNDSCIGSMGHMFRHWNENAATSNWRTTLCDTLGYVPRAPFFSFFYIGIVVFSKWIFISFILLTALYAIERAKVFFSKEHFILSSADRVLGFLVIAVCLHGLVIDSLPFTKLPRAHFTIFPFMIISTMCMFHRLLNSYKKRSKVIYSLMLAGGAFFLGQDVYSNIGLSSEVIKYRTHAPSYLQLHCKDTDLFILKEDPHSIGLKQWLSDIPLSVVSAEELKKTTLNEMRNRKIGLLLGPMGENAAKISIVSPRYHQKKINFLPEKILHEFNPVHLPYFSVFPTFLIEEEILKNLFFEGKVPDYRESTQHLTLYIFDKDRRGMKNLLTVLSTMWPAFPKIGPSEIMKPIRRN